MSVGKHAVRPSQRRNIVLGAVVAFAVGSLIVSVGARKWASASTPTTYSIYPTNTVPTNPAEDDDLAVELGVRFKVTRPGAVHAIRYYKSTANSGPHLGNLWTAAGERLASVQFIAESSSGWQSANLASPVALRPGDVYVASYHTSRGYYAQRQWAFANGGTLGNRTISAIGGTYMYGNGGFPDDTWHDAAYYVDVLFVPSGQAAPPSSRPSQGSTTPRSVPSAVTTPTTTPTSAPGATPSAQTTTQADQSSYPSATAGGSVTLQPTAASSLGFPDASNTGVPAGVTLRRVPQDVRSGPGWHATSNGSVHVDAANTTLSGLDVQGSVQNDYSSLTIRNTRIRCEGETDWCVVLGAHSVLTDTEIGGGADGHTKTSAIAVYSGGENAGNLIQRVNIHDQVHGLRLDGGTTLVDSYIHGLPMGDPTLNVSTGQYRTDYHTDGLMTTRNGGSIVRHNHIIGGNNCSLFVQTDVTDSAASVGSYLVENNFFENESKNGQSSSYGVGIESQGVVGPVTVRNNVFSRGWEVGPLEYPARSDVSGNLYTDGTSVR